VQPKSQAAISVFGRRAKKLTKNVHAEHKWIEPITHQGTASQRVEHRPGEATQHIPQREAAEVTTWEKTL